MKYWALGVLILIFYCTLGELSWFFGDYVFDRLGFSRDAFLLTLWLLPLIAAFWATYRSTHHKILAGLSYLIIFPTIGSIAHYTNYRLGGAVDFTGLSGAFIVLKIDLGIGCIIVTTGTFLGYALSKGTRDKNHFSQ